MRIRATIGRIHYCILLKLVQPTFVNALSTYFTTFVIKAIVVPCPLLAAPVRLSLSPVHHFGRRAPNQTQVFKRFTMASEGSEWSLREV